MGITKYNLIEKLSSNSTIPEHLRVVVRPFNLSETTLIPLTRVDNKEFKSTVKKKGSFDKFKPKINIKQQYKRH
jgi:hypothetical protein